MEAGEPPIEETQKLVYQKQVADWKIRIVDAHEVLRREFATGGDKAKAAEVASCPRRPRGPRSSTLFLIVTAPTPISPAAAALAIASPSRATSPRSYTSEHRGGVERRQKRS